MKGWKKKPFKYAGKSFVFRGLIRCAHCGCAITTEEKKGFHYLFCSKYKDKKCPQARVKEEVILEKISDIFKELIVPENILADLKERLQASHDAKKEYHNTALREMEKEYISIQDQLDVLLDMRIKRSITQDQYDKKAYDLKQRQHEIDITRKQHTKADEKFAITVSYLLDLSSKAYELFESSKVDQKRELINFVLWNASLNRGKLVYNLKKTFDAIAKANKCQNWLRTLESICTYFITAERAYVPKLRLDV